MAIDTLRPWALALLVGVGSIAGCRESDAPVSPAATTAPDATFDRSSLRAVLGSGIGSGGFAQAERPLAFAFPRDHGAHPAFRSEWWYLTAVLTDVDGREFGVQFTLFRQGLEPRERLDARPVGAAAWRTGQIFMGHAALADVAERRHLHEERLARGHPALAGVVAQPFGAYVEGWRLASVGEDLWPLRLNVEGRRFAFDLKLSPTKPIVYQGEDGLSRKGPDNASYYYSVPRIDAAGRVVVEGVPYDVAGGAWLDREWSTSVLAPEYAGWDWFALRLNDGRDLMLYQMRRRDGVVDDYNSGTLVDAHGGTRGIAADQFALAVLDRWRRWPVAWQLTLQGPVAEQLTIRAAFEDQVMDTSVLYWEGVVHVEDDQGERVGHGYMELTGY